MCMHAHQDATSILNILTEVLVTCIAIGARYTWLWVGGLWVETGGWAHPPPQPPCKHYKLAQW